MKYVSVKKKLIIIFVILVLIIFCVLIIFKYPIYFSPVYNKITNSFASKIGINATSTLKTLPEILSEKCSADLNEKTDDELMEEVKTIKYPEEKDSASEFIRITAAQREILDYLVCKVQQPNNENLYKAATEYISQMRIQEEHKQFSMDKLKIGYFDKKSLFKMLAFGGIKEVCPDELPKQCLAERNKYTLDDISCEKMCEMVADNQKIIDYIDNIINNDKWSKDENLLILQYEKMVALALRIKKSVLAKWVCENVPIDDSKYSCYKFVKSLAAVFKIAGTNSCQDIKLRLTNLICGFYFFE